LSGDHLPGDAKGLRKKGKIAVREGDQTTEHVPERGGGNADILKVLRKARREKVLERGQSYRLQKGEEESKEDREEGGKKMTHSLHRLGGETSKVLDDEHARVKGGRERAWGHRAREGSLASELGLMPTSLPGA